MIDEQHLREQLRTLAPTDAPSGLADRALRQADRRRHTGYAAGALGLVVAVAAAITIPLSLRHSDAPPAHPMPAPRDVVTSYVAYPSPNDQTSVQAVLDPSTGKYVRSTVDDVLGSPDGQRYVSVDGTRLGSVADVVAGRALPRPTGDRSAGLPVWSADSRRLLLSTADPNSTYLNGFRIYDAVGRHLGTPVHLRVPQADQDTVLGWGPQDKSVVVQSGRQLTFFGVDGHRQRSLRLPAGLSNGGIIQLSPDGRYLGAQDGTVLELSTMKRNHPRLPTAEAGAAETVGWIDSEHYVVSWTTKSGTGSDRRLLILSTDGRLIRSIDPHLGGSTLPGTNGKHALFGPTLGQSTGFPKGSGLRLDP